MAKRIGKNTRPSRDQARSLFATQSACCTETYSDPYAPPNYGGNLDPNGLYCDYLTSASYNDGLSNPSDLWTYDVAGNRKTDANTGSSTFDNLNRLLTSSSGSYGNNILGDRTGDPLGNQYGWDQLNWLTSFTPSGNAAWDYTYRLDGMRVLKSSGSSSTSFAYDGQMGFEDASSGASATVTDYALGGRGAERIASTSGGTTSIAYPLYDGHGNMVSTLAVSNTTFSVSSQRSYDAWGNIRNSNSSGGPLGRYCASLGHKADDESGLIYMHSRYYDPAVGRYASEDSAQNGRNWYSYCNNEPVMLGDPTGKSPWVLISEILGALFVMLGAIIESGLLDDLITGLAKFKLTAWIYDMDAAAEAGTSFLSVGTLVVGIGALMTVVGAVLEYCEIMSELGAHVLFGMTWDQAENATLNQINGVKENGSDAAKIGAAMAEIEVYLLDIDAGD